MKNTKHPVARLEDVAEIIMGQSPTGQTCNETGIGMPLLNGPTEFGTTNPTAVQFTQDAKKLAEKEDLLFCVRGSTTGRMNWADRSYAIGRGLAAIRHREGKEYKYFLKGIIDFNLNDLLAEATGSTFPNISGNQLKNMKVNIPPLEEQKHIAKILSDFDNKIELNNRMNRTLEVIAQAIFKHWFIDFEFPVKLSSLKEEVKDGGKLDLSSLESILKSPGYRSAGGKMVDSEMGKIPEGWEVKSLDEIADFLNGLALQKYSAKGNEYLAVIKIRELKQGISDDSDKAGTNLPAKYVIQDGDVLFSWSGSLEVVIWCNGKGALNQHLYKVTSENYPKWFYYHWLLEHLEDFRQVAEGKATTMGHIKRGNLTSAKVIVPTKQILGIGTKTIQPLINLVINNKMQNQTLSPLRDSLLPRLMSGKTEALNVAKR